MTKRFSVSVLVFALSMFACDVPQDEASYALTTDASVSCAHDAQSEPDAFLCVEAPTKGVLIGDSIVQNMYLYSRAPLVAGGSTVTRLAVAGDTIGNQIGRWMVSPLRGDETVDWIYVQIGINDILHGQLDAREMYGIMSLFIADIRANNPGALVYLSVPDPAKLKLDAVSLTGGKNRQQVWVEFKALLLANGGTSFISDALNDGNDSLIVMFEKPDHLHPNPAGDLLSGNLLRAKVDETFSCPDM